jgi:membrane-associated phospholipid phosphatase
MTRRSGPILAALACLAGLAITGVLAELVPAAHAHDAAGLHGFVLLNRPRLTPALDFVAHLADPGPYGLMIAALALVALARRRARLALAIVVVAVAAPLCSETLKPLLAQPRWTEWLGDGQISAASWPSGHATASMTIALCTVLAAPARLRPLAALAGGAYAVGVCYSILALGWHFPSDVVGGLFMAGFWVSLAVVVVAPAHDLSLRRAVPGPAGLGALAGAAVLGGAVVAGAAVLAEHPSFFAGALAIAGLTALLAAGLARGVRS